MKEGDPKEDIEEVKAETEEEVVEDVEGGGVLVVTPWLRGEASHAWGLSHANQRKVLTLPWVQAALESLWTQRVRRCHRHPRSGQVQVHEKRVSWRRLQEWREIAENCGEIAVP